MEEKNHKGFFSSPSFSIRHFSASSILNSPCQNALLLKTIARPVTKHQRYIYELLNLNCLGSTKSVIIVTVVSVRLLSFWQLYFIWVSLPHLYFKTRPFWIPLSYCKCNESYELCVLNAYTYTECFNSLSQVCSKWFLLRSLKHQMLTKGVLVLVSVHVAEEELLRDGCILLRDIDVSSHRLVPYCLIQVNKASAILTLTVLNQSRFCWQKW